MTLTAGVEFSDINWLALVLAMASNIVIGFLWYSPMLPTGRIWMKGIGMRADHKPKHMALSFALMIVGTFLLMFVLEHVFLAFRDAYRLDMARTGTGGLTLGDGAIGAFFVWLGFFLPVMFGTVAWEEKPWSLFLVNAGYYLVSLIVAGLILAAFI